MAALNYQLVCCDPFTGHLMDEQGVVYPGKPESPHRSFDDAEQAKAHARELVRLHPSMECVVIAPDGAQWTWRDEQWVNEEMEARNEADRRFVRRRQLQGMLVLAGLALLVGSIVVCVLWFTRLN